MIWFHANDHSFVNCGAGDSIPERQEPVASWSPASDANCRSAAAIA